MGASPAGALWGDHGTVWERRLGLSVTVQPCVDMDRLNLAVSRQSCRVEEQRVGEWIGLGQQKGPGRARRGDQVRKTGQREQWGYSGLYR